MDLKESELVDPYVHWYYRHKLRAVQSILAGLDIAHDRLTDVGAGSGYFAREISRSYNFREVACIDSNYSSNQVGRNEGMIFMQGSDGCPASLYVFMDVLEHVDDDVQFLATWVDEARKGTPFLITVPAFMSLWSSHDVYLEHRRRYTLQSLTNTCALAGLGVRRSRYLFAPTFPLVWLLRRTRRGRPPTSDLRQPHSIVNRALMSWLSLELRLTSNQLLGSTAAVVAFKL